MLAINIGNLSLLLLLAFAILNLILLKNRTLHLPHQWAYKSIFFQFACSSLALATLTNAYITNDYTLQNVVENSHNMLPLFYRIAATWGNYDGSMLLALWMITLVSTLFMIFAKFDHSIKTLSLAIQSAITLMLSLFVYILANPFIPSDIGITEGHGFNPLLQDHGLIIHPPILYYGYFAYSIVFTSCCSGLICRKIDRDFCQNLYLWIIIPWGMLSLGIGLGSWWAYRELGWGGFWFWDPVENVSLVVWSMTTALIHLAKLAKHRSRFYSSYILLGITIFPVVFLAVFLVRSGILVSVHSFALDQERGIFLLLITVTLTMIAIISYSRHNFVKAPNQHQAAFVNKDLALYCNNILLLIIAGVILFGVVYPVIYHAFSGKSLTIGEEFYKTTLSFLFIPLMLILTIFSSLKWQENRFYTHPKFFIALIATTVIIYLMPKTFSIYTTIISLALMCIFIIIFSTLNPSNLRKQIPMHLGHLGFAFIVLGAALCWHGQTDHSITLTKGEKKNINNYTIEMDNIVYERGPNYLSRIAILNIYDHYKIGETRPENRFYPVEKTFTHESSRISQWNGDLYFTIDAILNDQSVVIQMQSRPFISLLWLGIVLLFFSSIAYLIIRQYDQTHS